MASKKPSIIAHILKPSEYPAELVRARGAYTPKVELVAEHPLGTYYVEDEGAGHLGVYFTPRRKGAKTKTIGGASSLEGAIKRISNHEDELINPTAKREDGKNGPVSIWSLGKRVGTTKPETALDRLLAAHLAGK